ncbi:MAG: hypothetical protein WCI43_05300 [Candidatus Firestonebacteria bacterium]
MKKFILIVFVACIAGLILYYAKPGLFSSNSLKKTDTSLTQDKNAPKKETTLEKKTETPGKKQIKGEQVSRYIGPIPSVVTCPDCKKTGLIKCRACKGTGLISIMKCPSCGKQLLGYQEGAVRIYSCSRCKLKINEGNLFCDVCNGSKEEKCPRCNGLGIISGFSQDQRAR